MKSIKKSELLVYIFFVLISFSKGLGLGNSSKMYISAYIIGVIFVFIKLFNDKFTKKEILILLPIVILGVLAYIIGKESTILFTAIALVCMKNINIKSIIKIIFISRIVAFIIAIVLPLLGIVEMNTYYFYRASLGTYILRYSFIYAHPNLAHASFSILVILWGYLYFNKVTLFKIIILEFLNYVLYYYTFSRTGFLILTLYIIILYLTKKSKLFRNNIPKNLNLILMFSILISFTLAWGYGKYEIFDKINSLFTGRLKYMSGLLSYSIPLFGGASYGNIQFDNGYFDLIYNGGLLAFIWYIFVQLKTNKYIKEKKLVPESLMVMFFLLYNITENHYASIVMNISIIFFTFVIFKPKNSNYIIDND